MIVSVIVPACDAQSTIVRAIESLRAQTLPDWEAIVVADDRFDYAGFLSGRMGLDHRLRFATTGLARSGCHRARNVGLKLVRGDFVTQLDADDRLAPGRFAALVPLAKEHGAAADNMDVVADETQERLYRPLGDISETAFLDLTSFMKLNAPLVPLIRRDFSLPRALGVELAEDVVANIRLIDQIGRLPVAPEPSYIYCVRSGSIAHRRDSAERFEAAYTRYIDRLVDGDGFALTGASRAAALKGLIAKRELNRAFAGAAKVNPRLTFQEFARAWV